MFGGCGDAIAACVVQLLVREQAWTLNQPFEVQPQIKTAKLPAENRSVRSDVGAGLQIMQIQSSS